MSAMLPVRRSATIAHGKDGAVVDERVFRRFVREGLTHLYEPGYLRAHPLAALLTDAGLIRTSDELAGFLIAAAQQLRPAGSAPQTSPGWRQYRYLQLRYVEGLSHRRIAADLLISTRQACREHDASLNALMNLLWDGWTGAVDRKSTRSLAKKKTTPDARAGPTQSTEAELLRVGAEPPDGPISLDEVVESALATVSRPATARGLAFVVELAPSLPPVNVSRLALRHILLNVLGYYLETAEATTFIVAAQPGEGTVELEVRSTAGPGSDTTTDSAPRHAGLAMAERLAELQCLPLGIELSPGVGTRVVLSLPAAPAKTLLLVEDNPDVGRLFRRYLTGTGFCLIHARSAEKALQVARVQRPDVVVMDVLLPRDDGWQFLESLRAIEGSTEVPVIVCSVVPERALALSLGVAEFLPKPVSQDTLLSTLAKWCPLESPRAPPGSPSYSRLALPQRVPRSG